ncbi:MAG TPA: PIN domain nuclease [Jiangellaceae bacterium]|nr:PIN domain nuclease [Jiangellaceae bacterium]
MILVDTSAWIDYLRASDTAVAAELTALIIDGADLATTEAVVMELLAGGDTPVRADAIEKLTNGLPLLGTDPRFDFRQAASVFLAARRSGRTVRSLVDCLIAAVSLRHDVPLLHKDADYDAIASCLPLRIHPVDRR